MRSRIISFILFLTLISCQTNSNLKLPSLIGDNMVLQQKATAKIWGKANPGIKIIVSASWNTNGQAIAEKDGKWSVNLLTPEAGGPYTRSLAVQDKRIKINATPEKKVY